MEIAPFFADIIADAPAGRAYWLRTADQVKIRVGVWNETGKKGTVLLFPGRTEFVEKYAHTAADLAAAGYATLAIDWRGQGLADRLIANPLIGHVGSYQDYQLDVAAVVRAVEYLDLPQPLFLIGHSMGGSIGLRALYNNLGVKAAAFTAPMWGIKMPSTHRPAAWAFSWASRHLGLSTLMSPGTSAESYVSTAPFEDNMLTTDPTLYELMQQQLIRHPELSLAGPSLNWLHQALTETLALSRLPAPDTPCLTFLGSNERIVDPIRIRDRMASWPQGQLIEVPGAEHEILMERDALRQPATAEIVALFDRFASDSATNSASGPLHQSA